MRSTRRAHCRGRDIAPLDDRLGPVRRRPRLRANGSGVRHERAAITDVQMPGPIDGLRLAHLISIRWPKVKVIVTSGRLRLREDDVPAGVRCLHKPYDPSQLIGILDEWATNK